MSKAIDLKGLVLPQLVEVHRREDNSHIAEFRIQPLERGYGHTLGNAMRRMLLSSLRGSAVWGFRIDGVVHEHQTVPGVVEDVHLIIGNLKNLVLAIRCDADEDGIADDWLVVDGASEEIRAALIDSDNDGEADLVSYGSGKTEPIPVAANGDIKALFSY